jgi:spermidine synthase
LGLCQLLLAGAIAWSAFILARSLPYWPIDPQWSRSPWFGFQLDLLRCAWAILPAACLWGASFPLALAAAAGPGQDAGRLVGGVYATNTVGAIIGALATSVVLVSWIGSQGVQMAMVGVSILSAIIVLIPVVWNRLFALTATIAGVVLAGWLAFNVPSVPWELIAYGRYLPTYPLEFGKDGLLHNPKAEMLFVGEGRTSSVAVTELTNSHVRNFHVSGKVEASTEPQDMRLQRMLGHLPAMFHPHPQSVLIVGCGAGVTAGSFVVYPDVKRIVICEIEPLIPRVVTKFFSEQNYHVVNDPRVEIVFDDARHYLLRTTEKFDIITSDPIHPWVKGAATLYTQEYFELVRKHLNPGGFVTQWVPLYESNPAAVQCELATFFKVFPHGTVWSNDINGQGYDTVVLGRAGGADQSDDAALVIDVAQLQNRWNQPDRQAAAKSLSDVDFATPVDLLTTYAGCAADLAPWLKFAELNVDRNLRLQYLAGLGLNQAAGAEILSEMLLFFHYPADLFITTDEVRAQLEEAWRNNPPPLP